METETVQIDTGIQKIEFRAMGSRILAAVESQDSAVAKVLAEVPGWFAVWEETLSRFKDDSELSSLNRNGHGPAPVKVSETLWEVLQAALSAADYTGGLVTPTLLNALENAGYTASFDAMQRESTNAVSALDQVASVDGSRADWREIKTYAETRSVVLPAGVRLDFGGIAKGWAADQAASLLGHYGPSLVDAGGDIAIGGPAPLSGDWPIGIDAPDMPAFSPGDLLGILTLTSGGVATSGRDYRRWQQDGQWRHHIIDPRTGSPAETDVVSATVVAPSASMAEIAAKVALLLGSTDGITWLEERPSLAGMLVLENGQVVQSRRLSNYIWSIQNGD